MPPTASMEELLCTVATWDRDQLIHHFTAQQSRFTVDFTPDFYQNTSVERLRHIFVALFVQNRREASMCA